MMNDANASHREVNGVKVWNLFIACVVVFYLLSAVLRLY